MDSRNNTSAVREAPKPAEVKRQERSKGSNQRTDKTEILVDTQAEFFIAVAKKDIHSFVMLGEMQNGRPRLLARVGKTNFVDPAYNATCGDCRLFFKSIFSSSEAELQAEPLYLKGDISYAAYAITYQQYLQFVTLAGQAARTTKISCYQPVREEKGQQATMKFAEILQGGQVDPKSIASHVIARSKKLSMGNTCRHTAISLMEYTLRTAKVSDNISKTFFRDLPLKTHCTAGGPDNHFYVFPLPPTAHQLGEKNIFLTKIYKRMEELLKKDPYGENTQRKFAALKTLYNAQAGILANGSLDEALKSIQTWRASHSEVINHLRAQSCLGRLFTRRSSTVAMSDELERMLQTEIRRKPAAGRR